MRRRGLRKIKDAAIRKISMKLINFCLLKKLERLSSLAKKKKCYKEFSFVSVSPVNHVNTSVCFLKLLIVSYYFNYAIAMGVNIVISSHQAVSRRCSIKKVFVSSCRVLAASSLQRYHKRGSGTSV